MAKDKHVYIKVVKVSEDDYKFLVKLLSKGMFKTKTLAGTLAEIIKSFREQKLL